MHEDLPNKRQGLNAIRHKNKRWRNKMQAEIVEGIAKIVEEKFEPPELKNMYDDNSGMQRTWGVWV
jgi:hypothetical protein